MSEIKTMEHYIIDRIETLEQETILLKAERDYYEKLARETCEDAMRMAKLIKISTPVEGGSRHADIDVWEKYDRDDFALVEKLKWRYEHGWNRFHHTADSCDKEKQLADNPKPANGPDDADTE